MSSGCKQLASAMRELTKLPLEQQKTALQALNNLQCVECTQQTNISDITAGGDVNIDKINQIMSCGIGNSGSIEMVNQLKNFIGDTKNEIESDYNKKLNNKEANLLEKISQAEINTMTNINKLTKLGGLVAGVLFVLILILIIMKIINL